MRVKFYSPSYRRPELSITQITYPFVRLVVCESQADEYRKNGNDIVVCPDSAQGNLCRVRNWILDNLFDDCDCIVLLDDDCKGIGYWQEQSANNFHDFELEEACENWAQICKEMGYHFWGLNCVADKGAYREYTPYGTFQYIGGPFQAHLATSQIRYDENLPLKEDYDITLQHVQKYGGALRVNYAHYHVKQAEQAGGCATYRNLDYEKAQFWALQKKWGKDVIRRDKKSRRTFDFNPMLKLPLRGV